MAKPALRRTIEDNEGGQAGQCNGEPPLVPMSAELKLIVGLQKRVAKRTQEYDAHVPQPQRATDDGKAKLKAAADPSLSPEWPVSISIPEWTTYTKEQIVACKGPGE